MIKTSIIGATGYTGVELIRLLQRHPEVSIQNVTSDSESGRSISAVFPSLDGLCDTKLVPHDTASIVDSDLVFFATPHAVSMKTVARYLDAGCRIIDLSADFRIRNRQVWEKWYGVAHHSPELLEQAVYGLPEINRDKIKTAELLANPGCYPTAVSLALIPLLESGGIKANSIIADAKSGVSGAGRKAAIGGLFTECAESFKAYGVSGHRHQPEISQTLADAAGTDVQIQFVPHLVPMIRGIFATIYVETNDAQMDFQAIFEKRYKDEPFVTILPVGQLPDTASVRGSNHCRIAVHRQYDGSRLVLLSVIDNLVKGAAGQAVQNMNIMYGFDETLGLDSLALFP